KNILINSCSKNILINSCSKNILIKSYSISSPSPAERLVVQQHYVSSRSSRALNSSRGSGYNSDRSSKVRTQQFENAVLLNVALKPHTSTRTIATEMGASQPTIWRSLNGHNLHPYKVSHHQKLNAGDPARRFEMCNWFLDKVENVDDPGEDIFVRNIMFTDECTFQSDGTTNRHNAHHWSAKGNNPHCYQENRGQGHFSVIVWAGIVDDFIIGPYFWPNVVDFLNHELDDLLKNLPLEVRRDMWFQQDSHPAPLVTNTNVETAIEQQRLNRRGPRWSDRR
ncbi:hypothetical protein FOCC_FOCC015203, partial [Frankliniella occidentalis]